MLRDDATARGRATAGSLIRLLVIALAGWALAWALAPTGAAGQEYPLPTSPPPPPRQPAPFPPPRAPAPPPPRVSSPLPLLSPFPMVRIVGRTTRRGARITRLTVRAGAGTSLVSRCAGGARRCPYKHRRTRVAGRRGQIRTVHVRGFERSFRAGVVLRVYVFDAGRMGKFTSFRIRRGRVPQRRDRCIKGSVLRPVRC